MTALFDPRDWIMLPNGAALHRSDLGPCSCGSTAFDVRSYRTPYEVDGKVVWSTDYCIKCPACLPPEKERKNRAGVVTRTNEVNVGTLDGLTGEMRLNRG